MITRLLLIAALAVAVTACSYQPRIDILTGVRVINGHDEGMANCLRLSQRLAAHVQVEYEHCSDLRYGEPFNEKYDTSHDVLGVAVGWGGNKR